MKRRNLITAALSAPQLLIAGCASPTSPGATGSPNPAQAQVTVLYDAFGRNPALQRDWGYAALVEVGGKRILFDTGNNADVLAKNVVAMKADLTKLDFVVMSHRHGDHMGGMSYLFGVNPKVRIYAPKEGFGVYGSDLPSAFYRKDDALPPEQRYFEGRPPEVMRFGSAWPQANIVLVDKPTMIAPDIHLISLVSDKPGTLELRELSLALETPDGMVVVVGCSHTGIDNIVKAAAAIQPKVQCVVGGLHLVVAKDPDIEAIITTLRDTYKVAYVAPGHCTGEPTFGALRKAFGERCLYAGLGSTIALGAAPRTVGESQPTAPPALGEDDLRSYRTLWATSGDRRGQLFADLQRTTPGGAYLGQWRRSMAGCC
ncbi:MBL fold metallo-hydrolase [Variovorax sp. GT1P44]|uniref:MBL fold metallo-hydrolase n=1 Tax=Variovorax sp. GT1P44 TaxID=3443742 RepID=UPI003F44C369